MQAGSVARRYARALFELAQEQGQAEAVGRELELVVQTFSRRPELRGIWEHAEASTALKLGLVQQEFGDRVGQLVRNFLGVMAQKRRSTYLSAVYREYMVMVDEALGRVEVEVRSATELAPDLANQLTERLATRLHKQVKLRTLVDKELMGGLVIRVGDVLMDGSVRTRLRRMRQRLSQATQMGPA